MKYFLYLITRPFVVIAAAMGTTPMVVLSTLWGTAFIAYFKGSFYEAIEWMLLVILFVLCDLYFGVRSAIVRRERVTFSSAARRTISKIVGYFCWVLAFCCWAQQVDNEMYARIGCGLAAGVEALSAVGNYLEIHGYAISIKGFLKMLGNKFGLKGLEGAIVKDEKTQRGCGGIEYVNDNDNETPKND